MSSTGDIHTFSKALQKLIYFQGFLVHDQQIPNVFCSLSINPMYDGPQFKNVLPRNQELLSLAGE